MELSPEEKNAALELIGRFGDGSDLDDKFWVDLFRTDSLRVLPLDDPELSAKIRGTISPVSTQSKMSELFSKSDTLIRKVIVRRSKSKRSAGSGSISVRIDTNEPPFSSAIQAATALRLCQLFILYISKHFPPHEASHILGQTREGVEASLEGLVDSTLELIADTNVTATYYEVVLEGVNLLLSLLSSQFFSSENADFATSIDEDNNLAMTFYNQMKAREAAGAAMRSNLVKSPSASSSAMAVKVSTSAVPPVSMSGITVQTETSIKKPSNAPAPAQSRWYHFGFLGTEEEEDPASPLPENQSVPAPSIVEANTSSVASPGTAPGTAPGEKVDVHPSSVVSLSTKDPLPPLPTFGGRCFFGMELIMGSSFPTLIDEISMVKSKQSDFKPMIHLMKGNNSASTVSEAKALKIAKRLDQASLLVEAILTWFVRRPQTPTLLSAPATSAAIVALKNVEDAHSALTDVRLQYSWIETLRNTVAMMILTPLYPLLSALGFTNNSSLLTNSSHSPRHNSSNDAFLWPDSPRDDPELGGRGEHRESSLSPNKYYSSKSSHSSPSPLAERGVHLLLLLMHNYRSPSRANPYRAALAKLHDPRLEGLFEQTSMVSSSLISPRSPIISFEDILFSLTKSIQSHSSSEGSILLLYSLLHGNKLFTTSLLARSDLDTVIMPLLHRLYLALNNRQKAKSNDDKSDDIGVASLSSLYVAVTVLLTFTTDASFCATSFQHIIFDKVSWYQERNLTKISLGSLIILITLRLLVHTLRTLKDFFLVESLLAIIGNVSPHVFGVHCYAAERIVNIATMTLRNFQSYKQKCEVIKIRLHSEGKGGEESELAQTTSLSIVYGKCAQALASLIRVATRSHQLQHNGQLTYSLMRKKEELLTVLTPFLSPSDNANPNDPIEVLCREVSIHSSSLPRLLTFMSDRILAVARQPKQKSGQSSNPVIPTSAEMAQLADSENTRELTVTEIESVLENASSAYISNDEYEPLKVAYQEQKEPEAFFVGYAWEVAYTHSSDLLWQ